MTKNIVAMIIVLKGRMGGFFGGCGGSKLLISQFCAKTGEQKVIKSKLKPGARQATRNTDDKPACRPAMPYLNFLSH